MNKITDEEKITSAIKQMLIIFIAMVAGQISMLIAFVFLVESGNVSVDASMHETFKYAVIVISVVAVAAGQFLYQRAVKKNREAQKLDERLSNFRSASLMVLATLEGPALYALAIYFITGQRLYLAILGLLLIIFFYCMPTEKRFRNDFNND